MRQLFKSPFRYFKTLKILYWKRLTAILPFGHHHYSKFVILCTARTGSTWLHTLLNSHPNVWSLGEVVDHKRHRTQSLDSYFSKMRPFSIKAVGLKVFYGLEDIEYNQLLEQLLRDTSVKVIHLKREDRLSQYNSLQKAKNLRAWTKKAHKDQLQFEISHSEFPAFERKLIATEDSLKSALRNHVTLDLSYESLEKDTSDTLGSIQRFLGVKERNLFSLLEKQR